MLLPAVRAAAPGTIIVADGFSCREQIAQETSRQALHVVELAHMAMFQAPGGSGMAAPERVYRRDPGTDRLGWRDVAGGLLIAAAFVLAAKRIRGRVSPRQRRSRTLRM